MKKFLINIAGAVLLALAVSNVALADPIVGNINFAGGVTFDTSSANTATAVTSWVAPKIQDVSGDFASFVSSGDSVAIASPWSFNSGAVSNFWSVGGFSFDLAYSSIVFQMYGAVVVNGTGSVSGNGFGPSLGTWSFTSQNPAGRNGVFSFSGGSSVPDDGTTALLLGLGLVGMGLAGRRRKAV